MELSQNWITEGLVDFELKKYQLLAYLQAVEAQFKEARLYPPYTDLYGHYKNLFQLKTTRGKLRNQFPKDLNFEELEQVGLSYVPKLQNTELEEEIEQILDFALPTITPYLATGKELYEFAEAQIDINPLGLVQINNGYGFFLLSMPAKKEVPVYHYHITLYEESGEKYRGIHVKYLETAQTSLANTFEHIKAEVTKRHYANTLSASYLVEVKKPLPVAETVLPVTKRRLVHYLSTSGLPL